MESVANNRMPRIGLLIALVAIVGFVIWSSWDRDNPAGDGVSSPWGLILAEMSTKR